MTKRVIISNEDIAKLEAEFMELYNRFRPQSGNVDDIEMYNRMKRGMDFRRLMIKNKGNKHERPYAMKMYNELVRLVPAFRFYYKNKQQ